jgi:AbrB family looped-hinge helix DNA binding protein
MSQNSKTSLVVSKRGQITLPSEVRRKYGIGDGGVVTLEERPGELVLRPATVVEFEMYSDEDIARWDEEDELSEPEKSEIKKKLSR